MKRRAQPQGFTLIEVALAMLVIGVGIVAVFGLFPAGLDASRRTADETSAAMFAEEVFGGFRAKAQVVPWQSFNNIRVPIASSDLWAAAATVGSGSGTVVWRNPADTNLVERALRYELAISNPSPVLKALSLKVYPGEFGPTGSGAEVYEFYTEIFRRGP